jgi:thiol-disulfide isomerase/thioredoxin
MTMKKLLLGLCGLFIFSTVQAMELQPWKGGATPPLALKDLNGKIHKLEDYRGKTVMVQFWATWCPPCLKEIPAMQRLEKKMAGKPFVILAVNMGETQKDVSEFVNKMKIGFTVLMDEEGKGVGDWKVFVAPSSFLIDPQGKVRYTLQGGAEWDDKEYVRLISDLMPGK